MVTAYYMMKMAKNNTNPSICNYYNDLPNLKKIDNLQTRCRICLKTGTLSIFDDETYKISEVLQCFTDIKIRRDDNMPKLLCETCYDFTKAALLFRRTAKRSDEIFQKLVKNENVSYSHNSDHDCEDSSNSFEPKVPEYCQKNESNLKIEQKKEKPVKVTCHICSKVINRSYYKEHITMHDPNHKQYVCDVCGKSFRLRCAYHNHSLRHSEDFPFKCNFCPYKGRYKELLKTHMKTHTGDYRYMCTECPARFLFKSNLNSHMLKHKEPQFKCDSCKRAFHTKLLLQRHFEADHLGIKNHVCNACGKAFGYRNAMMKHQRHVHKREKFLFGRMPAYLEAENKKVDS
ncbi:zinc finger protein 626-like [Plodia interpunctella]|uniref:zinc finger protein 626-like n=1 Tax=Plodia interpunctella TaxID=58824 RepID=UPI0023684644|nr:zinc finger protein 626-like [Plodia interpunctella]